ncbi:MAG: EAL domain-containing protein [Deltaproteobacteria bacterium]|nr:EAL domain-containing protein [Candidatus Anaeroferrophillacea bacterium]
MLDIFERQKLQNKIIELQEKLVRKEQEDHELSLQKNSDFMHILTQAAPLMVMVKEAGTGRFVFWNRQCEKVTGYQLADVIGKTAFDIFPPEQAAVFQAGDREVVDRGEPIEFDGLALTPRSGPTRIVRVIKTPLFLDSKNPLVIAHAQDITEQHEMQCRMEEQRLLKDAIFNSIPSQMAVIDEDGKILAVNRAWLDFGQENGADEETLLAVGTNYLDLCARVGKDQCASGQDALRAERGLREVLTGKRSLFSMEYDCHSDRQERFYLMKVTPLCSDRNRRGAVVSHTDITARRRAENIIRASHRRVEEQVRKRTAELQLFAKIFGSALEGMTLTDPQGTILNVNEAFTTITGYEREEVLGKNPRVLKSEKHDDDFYRRMWQELIHNGRWEGEVWNRRKSGEVYPEWLSVNAITGDDGRIEHFIAVFHDITEIKEKEARITELAYNDPLTGLPNRTLMIDRLTVALSQAQREQRRVAVLFLDLDNFKMVNDSLGHPLGDRLLIEVGRHLTGVVRQGDTVARLGGDEFLIINPLRQNVAVPYLAERILASFKQPFRIDGHDFFITSSIGIAIFPDDGETPDQLVKNADIAMYQAKNEGKGCFRLFDQQLNDRLMEQVAIERDLRAALAERAFPVYYQPKVEPTYGNIVGMEALVRWRRPDGILVPPDRFIPVAEETGMIREIGLQVLEQACRDTLTLHARGFPMLRVSVNISAVQFKDRNLVPRVLQILHETGLDAAFLDLEITETTMMADLEATERSLRQLAEHGITLSVDDFGTGYSSLYYLKRFPFRTVKIDRSFVRDIHTNEDDAAIVSAILHMASSLNLETVAEGVEDREQLIFLQRHGVDLVQGYLYSPPVPFEQFLKLLQGGMNST